MSGLIQNILVLMAGGEVKRGRGEIREVALSTWKTTAAAYLKGAELKANGLNDETHDDFCALMLAELQGMTASKHGEGEGFQRPQIVRGGMSKELDTFG